jgi:cytidylate kinase
MAFMFLCETIDVDNVARFILRRSCCPANRYHDVYHLLLDKLSHARLCVRACLFAPFSSQFASVEHLLDRRVRPRVS